jgi:O-antigen ligase
LSAAFSESTFRSVVYILLTLLSILIWSEIRGYLGHEFTYMLRLYAILGCLSLMPAFIRGPSASIAWNRLTLTPTDHPNHLASVCMAVLVAALAWQNWIIRISVMALMTIMIVQTGSRAHLVGSVFAVLVYLALKLKGRVRGGTKLAIIGALIIFAATLGFLHEGVAQAIGGALNLNDKYRGIDSGLSGRFDLWNTGLEMFAEHPVIGVGFRVHDDLLPDNIKMTFGSVHDGYLATFIEVGVFGAIPFFAFMFLRVRYVWLEARGGSDLQMLGMSFIAGLLAVALVQPLMLNLASPLPTVAWCFIVGPVASYARRASCAMPPLQSALVARRADPAAPDVIRISGA